MGKREEEQRRKVVRDAERRQAEKLRMCDADELAYRIILFAKPAGNNSTCICQIFHPPSWIYMFIPLKANK